MVASVQNSTGPLQPAALSGAQQGSTFWPEPASSSTPAPSYVTPIPSSKLPSAPRCPRPCTSSINEGRAQPLTPYPILGAAHPWLRGSLPSQSHRPQPSHLTSFIMYSSLQRWAGRGEGSGAGRQGFVHPGHLSSQVTMSSLRSRAGSAVPVAHGLPLLFASQDS